MTEPTGLQTFVEVDVAILTRMQTVVDAAIVLWATMAPEARPRCTGVIGAVHAYLASRVIRCPGSRRSAGLEPEINGARRCPECELMVRVRGDGLLDGHEVPLTSLDYDEHPELFK